MFEEHEYDCPDCLGTGYEEPAKRIINLEIDLAILTKRLVELDHVAIPNNSHFKNELATTNTNNMNEPIQIIPSWGNDKWSDMIPPDPLDIIRHDMDQLKRELANVTKERDNMVKINRILRDRPDLGDRARSMDELIKQRDALAEAALRLAKIAEQNTDDTDLWVKCISDVRELATIEPQPPTP